MKVDNDEVIDDDDGNVDNDDVDDDGNVDKNDVNVVSLLTQIFGRFSIEIVACTQNYFIKN